jgi:hypothetical protein
MFFFIEIQLCESINLSAKSKGKLKSFVHNQLNFYTKLNPFRYLSAHLKKNCRDYLKVPILQWIFRRKIIESINLIEDNSDY